MALSPKRKRRLQARAEREVARETAGAGAGARAAISQANREYGRNVADARGAHRVMSSQLRSMQQNLGAGLTRRDRSMLRSSLKSQIAQSAAGVPYAVQRAQEQRTDTISAARAELADAQADRQAKVGKRFNQLLDDARRAKADRVEEKREKSGLDRGVRNAIVAIKAAWPALAPEDQAGYLKDPVRWASDIAKATKSVDNVDARQAVKIMMRRIQRDRARGALEQVYGSGSFAPKKKKRR